MIRTLYNWLNKFYSFYYGSCSKHGHSIDTRHTNQSNKRKLALCKLLIHNYSNLKQLYVRNKTTHFSYKLGVVRIGINMYR